MELRQVGILDFARSPISRTKNGALNKLTSLEISAQVVKKLLERNPTLPKDQIESVVVGCAFPEAENGLNIGRALVIKAGLSQGTAGVTVNQFCASSQAALMMIADAIACGKGDIGIVVGVEHMSRVPMGGFNPMYDKELAEAQFYMGMGDTAENLAKDLDISRDDQDAFAAASHEKALAAIEAGAFSQEIVPITLPDGSEFTADDCPRKPDLEKIKSLRPAFQKDGTVTAATSSPVTVGAAAAILISKELAEKLELSVRADIVTTAVAGCEPTRMGMGPLPATAKALARAGLDIKDMDIIELNEAFAAQSLYVIRKGGWNADKVNVLGGAIALGHPLGMSGVRIVGTAITALEKNGGKHALATMCVGGGQGAATILRKGN
jgi:acetyl-CoA acyltransferase